MAERKRPLVCFYGDDFTGSTDAAAQYRRFGLETVLLPSLRPAPELAEIAASVDVLGIAGISRSLQTEEMESELRPVFAAFAALRPTFVQYKICSTFDSSPTIGSFGRVCELAWAVFGRQSIPVVAAQPEFGRYTLFGNHFARAQDGLVYRLDRHPTMARHPVTPIDEADLVVHLARQWPYSAIRSVDLPTLLQQSERLRRTYRALLRDGPFPIVFDAVQDGDLMTIGRLLWESRQGKVDFVMGSGGLSFALASTYAGTVGSNMRPTDLAWQPVDRMLAVSGSCAPGTGAQIEAALTAGWKGLRIDAARPSVAGVTRDVLHSLEGGRSVVVYSAIGHADREQVEPGELGGALARIVERAVRQAGVRRLLVAGGDTSGYVVRSLPIDGLQVGATPEVLLSLCTISSHEAWLDGVEVILKGGQVGRVDLFERTKSGQIFASGSSTPPSGGPPRLTSGHRPAPQRRRARP